MFATQQAIEDCLNYFISLADRGVNLVAINASGGASRLVNLGGALYAQVRDHYRLDTPAIAAAITALEQRNIAVVAAAGNFGWDIDANPERAYYPAAFPHSNVIGVGALDQDGSLASFSSYGRTSIDVMAPGRGILSASPSQLDAEGRSQANYLVSDGTSQATAFVTGIVALLKTNPATANLPPVALKRLLMASGSALPLLAEQTRAASLVKLVDQQGSGALSCQNRLYQRPMSPLQDLHNRLPGEQILLQIERYRCAQADNLPYLEVQVVQTGEMIALYDDGQGADSQAGDGIYSATWQIPEGHLWLDLDLGQDSVRQAVTLRRITTALVVDNGDRETERQGSWWSSIYRSGYYGHNYAIAYKSSTERRFTWLPEVTRPGYYAVYARWPRGPFASNAIYQFSYQDQALQPHDAEYQVNQGEHGGEWYHLGNVDLATGWHRMMLTNQGADATVAADAILLQWISPTATAP